MSSFLKFTFGFFVFLGLIGLMPSCSVTNSNEPTDGGIVDLPPLELTNLVNHENWSPLPPEVDPFAEHRNPDDRCPSIAGFKAERFSGEDTLEIITAFCTYASFQQGSQHEIRKGDAINFRMWHFKLVGKDGFNEAHLTLQIGGWKAWDATLDMPRGSKLITLSTKAPKDFPKGTPIIFHIHNHGANTYHLIEVSVQRP